MNGAHLLASFRAVGRALFNGRAAPAAFFRSIDGVDYFGWVDGLRDGRLVGWVAARASPDRLTVVAEGLKARRAARADLYRADVQRLGYSASGYCGFSIPAARFGDSPVRVFVLAPRFELGGSPAVLAPAQPQTSISPSGDGRWLVAVDAGTNRLSGWVCDQGAPARRPLLRLEHEGAAIESCRAAFYRRDADAALGDGWRGFSFGPLVAPGAYVIRDAETATELFRLAHKASG